MLVAACRKRSGPILKGKDKVNNKGKYRVGKNWTVFESANFSSILFSRQNFDISHAFFSFTIGQL